MEDSTRNSGNVADDTASEITPTLVADAFTAIVVEGNLSEVRADLELLLGAAIAYLLDVRVQDLATVFRYSRHGCDFEAIVPGSKLWGWVCGTGSRKSLLGYRVFEANFEVEAGNFVEAVSRMYEVSRNGRATPSRVA